MHVSVFVWDQTSFTQPLYHPGKFKGTYFGRGAFTRANQLNSNEVPTKSPKLVLPNAVPVESAAAAKPVIAVTKA